MKRETLKDNIAKAIADAAGHGMREKCERHADAVLDVLTAKDQLLERDERILWGVVANAGRLSGDRKQRWAHVVDATGQGSQSSIELCQRFGFDPDELRGGDRQEDVDG
jgi:hypothetical protein